MMSVIATTGSGGFAMHRTDLYSVHRQEAGRSRRRRLLALCPLLLIVLMSLACIFQPDLAEKQLRYVVRAPSDTVAVGESVTFTLSKVTYAVTADGEEYNQIESDEDEAAFEWFVEPAEGATCVGGVFIATAAGTYSVGISPGTTDDPALSAQITVVEKPAALEYDNHNSNAVQNNGTPPTFEVTEPATIATIETYHWNNGTGSSETGEISLQAEDGTVYGPWETEGTDGQGGVPNAYWTASPTLELPEGSYTVLDSDPGTWAQNAGTKGQGMVRIYTVPEE